MPKPWRNAFSYYYQSKWRNCRPDGCILSIQLKKCLVNRDKWSEMAEHFLAILKNNSSNISEDNSAIFSRFLLKTTFDIDRYILKLFIDTFINMRSWKGFFFVFFFSLNPNYNNLSWKLKDSMAPGRTEDVHSFLKLELSKYNWGKVKQRGIFKLEESDRSGPLPLLSVWPWKCQITLYYLSLHISNMEIKSRVLGLL